MKNNKEKFLMDLLNSADFVTIDTRESDYFRFTPKNINFEVRIPYNQYSSTVNVNFVLRGNLNSENGTSLTFSSIDEIPNFMAEVYKRYNKYLNEHVKNTTFPQEALDKIDEILRTPIHKGHYPYFLDGKLDSLNIRDNLQPHGIQIDLGASIYDRGEPTNLNPLSFLVIDCAYKDEATSVISMHKKLIPAFMIEQYPSISNVVKMNKFTDNLHTLTDALYELDHNSGAVLTSMILDLELPNKQIKSNRNKI
jgi:hypothetical protein